jgi:DNA-binding transcriptional ArsR family regulator
MLLEIATAEPVALADLPEARNSSPSTLSTNLRRLVAQGLVQRFVRLDDHLTHWLVLNRGYPQYDAVRGVLAAIGNANGVVVPPDRFAGMDDYRVVRERITYASLRLWGNTVSPALTLFGSPNRTNAILLVGAIGSVDATTIARAVGVATDSRMLQLLRPIENDDIIECEVSGNFTMYRLKAKPWTTALRALIEAILDAEKDLRSQINAAAVMNITGGRRELPRRPGVVR